MRSNYRPIGDYIALVDERNKDLKVTRLLGLSVSKEFIPSVANTVGTNMRNYKIIRKNQFACSTMQVRRDRKMPVALLQDFEEAIISQAYPVFEVVDTHKLLPEYLMMWFSRAEFDRHAEFLAVGGVRGTLEWEDFLGMELPVPSLEKQQQIVKEYNIIADRIKLNDQLNQKLEETAQALYKHWFVDFEFPNKNGQPYKSSGGTMVYNDELNKEIPAGWEVETLDNHLKANLNNYSKEDNFSFIEYYDTSSVTGNKFQEPQLLDVARDVIPSRARRKVEHNDLIYSTVRPNLKHFGLIKRPSTNTLVSTGYTVLSNSSDLLNNEFFLLLLSEDEIINYFQSKAEMSVSTYPSIKPEDILGMQIAVSNSKTVYLLFNQILYEIFDSNNLRDQGNLVLKKLKTLLFSKMATTVREEKVVQ